MSAMLLSIKPRYARGILEGKKRYEFRKNKPKRSVTRIVVDVTPPKQRGGGKATIDEILEGSTDEIWSITKGFAGITKQFFSSYYAGRGKAIAYKLTEVTVYETPKDLSDFGVARAPQSFTYLD